MDNLVFVYCKKEKRIRGHVFTSTASGKTIYAKCDRCGSIYHFSTAKYKYYKFGWEDEK